MHALVLLYCQCFPAALFPCTFLLYPHYTRSSSVRHLETSAQGTGVGSVEFSATLLLNSPGAVTIWERGESVTYIHTDQLKFVENTSGILLRWFKKNVVILVACSQFYLGQPVPGHSTQGQISPLCVLVSTMKDGSPIPASTPVIFTGHTSTLQREGMSPFHSTSSLNTYLLSRPCGSCSVRHKNEFNVLCSLTTLQNCMQWSNGSTGSSVMGRWWI